LLVECFGPTSLVVGYDDEAELLAAAGAFGGQLAAVVHGEEGDAVAPALLALLVGRAGRVIWNGWPTGVAVTGAMHHGGPYPATTAPLHTSVGTAAIGRFLRPVCYQSMPDALLPPALRRENPLRIPRTVNGRREGA
jgi:NADP-dependent aldehyde dehydrogenase